MLRTVTDERGFTLVELVVVLAVLSVLVTIVVASYASSTARAAEMADRTNLRTIRVSVAAYKTNSPTGSYPATLADLYPGYISSTSAMRCAVTRRPYAYDPDTGDVTDPDHPDR